MRARSGLYAEASATQPLHPLDALELATRQRPTAGEVWLARLENMREDTFADITGRIPESVISDSARTFALRMLATTRRLILARAKKTST